MCGCFGREHRFYPLHCHGFWPPLISVEEEIRELEEYREALEKELDKVKKRLDALKR
jgi:hypothetical protein